VVLFALLRRHGHGLWLCATPVAHNGMEGKQIGDGTVLPVSQRLGSLRRIAVVDWAAFE
jgi:hypothetical protein